MVSSHYLSALAKTPTLEYTVRVKGISEDEGSEDEYLAQDDDHVPMMDDDYGAPPSEDYDEDSARKRSSLLDASSDSEIGFSPNITLRRPTGESPSEEAAAEEDYEAAHEEEDHGRRDPATPKPKSSKKKSSGKKAAAPAKPRPAPAPRRAAVPQQRKTADSTSPAITSFYLSDEFHAAQEGGSRHSRRNRIAPLEFWRGETVKYSVDQELKIPVVVGVLRRTKTPQKPKQAPAKRKPAGAAASKRRREVEEGLEDAGFVPGVNVVEAVIDYDTHEEEVRQLAIGSDQHVLEKCKGEQFSICTVFEEGHFLTSGVLSFPPGVSKPSRNSAGFALVFYVISGVFQVTIHDTQFVIGTGGQFMVPRGNHYSLKNVQDEEAKLHFVHCKDAREV